MYLCPSICPFVSLYVSFYLTVFLSLYLHEKQPLPHLTHELTVQVQRIRPSVLLLGVGTEQVGFGGTGRLLQQLVPLDPDRVEVVDGFDRVEDISAEPGGTGPHLQTKLTGNRTDNNS